MGQLAKVRAPRLLGFDALLKKSVLEKVALARAVKGTSSILVYANKTVVFS